MVAKMQVPGPCSRWLISASLRASQKNLHCNKLPCDSIVHSGLKAALLCFSPNLLSIEIIWECFLKIWLPSYSHGDFNSWLWSGVQATGVLIRPSVALRIRQAWEIQYIQMNVCFGLESCFKSHIDQQPFTSCVIRTSFLTILWLQIT